MSSYARGKYSFAICPRSGFKVPYSSLRQEWTGLWVSAEEWEPKHEQLTPKRKIFDPQALDHPYPDDDDGGPMDGLPQLESVFVGTFSQDTQPL